jgi:hypothetical protein
MWGALHPDHFLHWFPRVVDAHRAAATWPELQILALEDYDSLELVRDNYAAVLAIERLSRNATAETMRALDQALNDAVVGPLMPNVPAVVDLAAHAASDALIAHCAQGLIQTGDEHKNDALDAPDDEQHGVRLRGCTPYYQAAYLLARHGSEERAAGRSSPFHRLTTVADERGATAGTAITSWFEGSNGDRMPWYQRQLGLLANESGREAAERQANKLIERLWFFPRVHRAELLRHV